MGFLGTTICKLDSSGRLKLSPQAIADFRQADASGKVTLRLMPEGALLLAPTNAFAPEKAQALSMHDYLNNAADRTQLRRGIYFTADDEISQQGRITIPAHLLRKINVLPGGDVTLVGVFVGIEIWNPDFLERELDSELEEERQRALRQRSLQ